MNEEENEELNELIPISQRERLSPTSEEIITYGHVIGLDLENQDQHLRWIGKQAIMADLPVNWKVFQMKDS